MPAAATELTPLCPGIWIWEDYDPDLRTDLFSSALATAAGLYLVDPISLAKSELTRLSETKPIAGIVVTNANHARSACEYSERLTVPIFAHARAFADAKPARFTAVENASLIGGELEVIAIEGAAAGEIALYHASNGGSLIVGDALINFEPYGFTFLPRKYCLNEKQMRNSLHQLLTRGAERILFAHGTPILSGATARLRQLLEVDR